MSSSTLLEAATSSPSGGAEGETVPRRRPRGAPEGAPPGFFDLPAVVRESAPGVHEFRHQRREIDRRREVQALAEAQERPEDEARVLAAEEQRRERHRERHNLFADAGKHNNMLTAARKMEVLDRHERTGRVPMLGRMAGRDGPVPWLVRRRDVSAKMSADFDVHLEAQSTVRRTTNVLISPPLSGMGSDGLRVSTDGGGSSVALLRTSSQGAKRMREHLRRQDRVRREQLQSVEAERVHREEEERALRKGRREFNREKRAENARNVGGFLDQDLPLEKISSRVKRQPVLLDMARMVPREGHGSYFRDGGGTSPDWERKDALMASAPVFDPKDLLEVQTPREPGQHHSRCLHPGCQKKSLHHHQQKRAKALEERRDMGEHYHYDDEERRRYGSALGAEGKRTSPGGAGKKKMYQKARSKSPAKRGRQSQLAGNSAAARAAASWSPQKLRGQSGFFSTSGSTMNRIFGPFSMATEAQLLEPGAARTGLRWPDTMLEHEKKVPSFDQYADRDAPVIGGARPTEETEISRAPNYKVLSTKRREDKGVSFASGPNRNAWRKAFPTPSELLEPWDTFYDTNKSTLKKGTLVDIGGTTGRDVLSKDSITKRVWVNPQLPEKHKPARALHGISSDFMDANPQKISDIVDMEINMSKHLRRSLLQSFRSKSFQDDLRTSMGK